MFALLLGLAVVLCDQLTKQAVRANLTYSESRPLIDGFFNLVYFRNDGAAWNLLSGHGLILILISTIVLILLLIYHRSFLQNRLLDRIILGLMVGGIIGNLIDRIRFGWVTDFLDFQFGATYHYPSFNVADSSICIAVTLYIVANFFASKKNVAIEERRDG
jgi:signal peptidase II